MYSYLNSLKDFEFNFVLFKENLISEVKCIFRFVYVLSNRSSVLVCIFYCLWFETDFYI